MLIPPVQPQGAMTVLESIYNIGGGKQQSPLARYLSSVSGAAAGGPTNVPVGVQPFGAQTPVTPRIPPNIGRDGNPTPTIPGATPPGAAGTAQNPLGADIAHESFDYSTDPALQAMIAGGAQDETTADAQALAARRSVLGAYGDRGLAESVLGADDPTLGSISDNPDTSTSTLARLKRTYAQTVHDDEESMNQGNLFYGGARIKHLGDLGKDEQTNEADANTAVKQALDQIGATLGSQKAGIRSARAQAESDAASRAAQDAILRALMGGLGGNGDSSAPSVAVPQSGSAAPADASAIPHTPFGEGGGALTPNPGGLGQAPAPPMDPALLEFLRKQYAGA